MDQREIIGELKKGEPVNNLTFDELWEFEMKKRIELASRERELHRHFDPDSAMVLANKLAEMMQEELNQHQ